MRGIESARKMLFSSCCLIAIAFFIVCPAGSTQAETSSEPHRDITPYTGSTDGFPPVPFGPGEKLTFSVQYGFVKAGDATLGVPDIVEYNGRPCYLISSKAVSNKMFSLFFRVEDRAMSYLDSEHLVPLRFEKHLREGDYSKDQVVRFDHARGVAVYDDGEEEPIDPRAQDILSTLFLVRGMELEVGKSVFVNNHADKKNYPLEVKVLKRETISTPVGRFKCLKVEPVLRASGIFQHEGKLTVWLTDDDRRLPVLMRSKVAVGAISAIIAKIELPEQAG
jgi:hypothetical protein